MTEGDFFKQSGDAYLRLIHSEELGDSCQRAIAPLLALAPGVPRELVSRMIVGASWRERLLGLALAMANRPERFIAEMLESLRDIRGISIVPTCAALAVLARHGLFDARQLSSGSFDRAVFDGEVGWAIDQAIQHAEAQSVTANERGPNFGQSFAGHVEMYEWMMRG